MNYPPPSTPTPRATTAPRALAPIVNKPQPPISPEAAELVSLTSRTFLPGWTCSTHVCPAATPRDTPTAEIRRPPAPAQLGKSERQALVDANFERMKALRNDIALGSTTIPNDSNMWTVLNRYAPDKPRASNDPGVTVITSHASGFHKEIWETTFRHLIPAIESDPRCPAIDEIWALDAVNHGDSALLNMSNLGDILEWSDHARDILNFVINYLPESIGVRNGASLARVSAEAVRVRRDRGFESRIIVGLGHSFGGCTLARAVIDSPNLFSSMILVDPVIYSSYVNGGPRIDSLTKGALARRDHWPDRESAKAGLLSSPFFQAWHPDVLADYVKYAMYEFEGQVRLKCSGYQASRSFANPYDLDRLFCVYQEGATFSENARLPCDVWQLLPLLPERIPLKWIMDSTTAMVTGGYEHTQRTVWRRPTNSSNVRIQGAGHLIPHEAPEALAHEIVDFLRVKHGKSVAKSRL